MKTFRKFLALTLCLIMLLGSGVLEAIGIKASAAVYSDGIGSNDGWEDATNIRLGSYPQSMVEDEEVIAALNDLAGDAEWISYGYYSGTGIPYDGQMTAGDYMKYIDITYDGNKYRGVYFTEYRPYLTGYINSEGTYQDNNNYSCNTTYWFKYEPLTWHVIDPEEGLVWCTKTIDAQAFNNYCWYGSASEGAPEEFYGDEEHTYYANDYYNSSIRKWLTNDFCSTAFSEAQQECLLEYECDNSCPLPDCSQYDSQNSVDKVFLLSYNDIHNTEYGFKDGNYNDRSRNRLGTDYARCQGLLYDYCGYANSNGEHTYYWLRSPQGNSNGPFVVSEVGYNSKSRNYHASYTFEGVCPALKLNLKAESLRIGADNSASPTSVEENLTNAAYMTYVTADVAIDNLPSDAMVYIDGKQAEAEGDTYYVSLGQLDSDKVCKVEIIQDGQMIEKSPLKISVDNGFFARIVSFFKNFLFNGFRWKETTVKFRFLQYNQ